MNDGWRYKRAAGLCQTLCDRRLTSEGYDDKLQTDQGTVRRPEDYVEVLPSGECCHVVTSSFFGPVPCRKGVSHFFVFRYPSVVTAIPYFQVCVSALFLLGFWAEYNASGFS